MRWTTFRIISGFGCAAVLALSACGSTDEGDGVGEVTAGEARALNEAAAMLDARADNAATALNVGNASQEN